MSGAAQAADLTSTFTNIIIEANELHASVIHCKEQLMQETPMPWYRFPT